MENYIANEPYQLKVYIKIKKISIQSSHKKGKSLNKVIYLFLSQIALKLELETQKLYNMQIRVLKNGRK